MGLNKQHAEERKVQEYPTQFEDALRHTGTGRFHFVLLLVAGIGLAGAQMETCGTSFLLPSAQCDFGFTAADKGLLNAIYPIGMICGSHMWGYLADTKGRRSTLAAALLLDGICALLSSFSHTLWLFLAFRFFCGFLTVGSSTVIYTYLGEFHASETRSKNLLLLSIFTSLGIGIIQPVIAWLIISQTWEWHLPWCVYKPWRMFIVVCTLPSIIPGIVLLLFMPETPKFLMVLQKEEESLAVLRRMYAWNTGRKPDEYPVKSAVLTEEGIAHLATPKTGSSLRNFLTLMWKQTSPLVRPPFLWKTVLACFLQYGLYAGSNGLTLWLPDIFNSDAKFAELYPNTAASYCEVYAALKEHRLSMYNDLSPDPASLHGLNTSDDKNFENDSLAFTCDNITLPSSAYDYGAELNSSSPTMKCLNKTSINSAAENAIMNGSEREVVQECDSEVDFSAFQNTLLTGVVGIVVNWLAAYLVGPIGKKKIIFAGLIACGIAGCCLDEVNSGWEFFGVSLTFVTLTTLCTSVTVSVVVEIFPTNVRAMAIGLTLMFGRFGSFTANMLLGSLVEGNCPLTGYLLGGICACCGIISVFLPSQKKNPLYS